jgi:hypothetical protein
MTIIVAVVLAFGAGFLVRPLLDDDDLQDSDITYADYRQQLAQTLGKAQPRSRKAEAHRGRYPVQGARDEHQIGACHERPAGEG